jgi:hypothetical protein
MGRDKPAWKLHQYVWYLANGVRVRGLDHINCDKQDNRIGNLRLASKALQGHNRRGMPKARFRKSQSLRPWSIAVHRHGKSHERYFHTEREAVEWATNAKQIIVEFEALMALDAAV